MKVSPKSQVVSIKTKTIFLKQVIHGGVIDLIQKSELNFIAYICTRKLSFLA